MHTPWTMKAICVMSHTNVTLRRFLGAHEKSTNMIMDQLPFLFVCVATVQCALNAWPLPPSLWESEFDQ